MNYKLIQTNPNPAQHYVKVLRGDHDFNIRIIVEDDKLFVEDHSCSSRSVRCSFLPDVEVKTDNGFATAAHDSFFEALNKLGSWYVGKLIDDCALKLEAVVEEAKQNGQYVSP